MVAVSAPDLGFVGCPSGKLQFATEAEALAELARVKRRGVKGRRQGKVERYHYQCPLIGCGSWHLSAMKEKRMRRMP